MPPAGPSPAATLGAAAILAAALAAGVALWQDWGLLVFLNGGGLFCF
ncbi:hypothetical protein [Caenispirillum bisanense]|uniref:Uncharacterized protein n=1 Tax=Caenispirillum bisanense TaxID=414052 RepID=A0A286G026_9PROT|nr:hypothetical protein [Caenispirillum bisanense]SOD88871.1 hypothetical protein SAMN05421508_10133 [Caenispirillum bisanense]